MHTQFRLYGLRIYGIFLFQYFGYMAFGFMDFSLIWIILAGTNWTIYLELGVPLFGALGAGIFKQGTFLLHNPVDRLKILQKVSLDSPRSAPGGSS